MYDYRTHRPYGAPDQNGGSQLFRNKPSQVDQGLQSALMQGGTSGQGQTNVPYEQGGITGGADLREIKSPPFQSPEPPPINGTHPFDYKVMNQNPAMPPPFVNIPQPASGTPTTAPDTSQWNTKGFATPQYIAQATTPAPSGWDQTKWADPNYQNPKYVVGRIEMEASGGDGYFDTPAEKQNAIDGILKAYPNATFDGKDHIDFHDGGAPVDVIRASGSDRPGISFAPDEQGGGGSVPGIQGLLSSPFQLSPTVSSPEGARSYLEELMKQLGQNPALLRALQGGQ